MIHLIIPGKNGVNLVDTILKRCLKAGNPRVGLPISIHAKINVVAGCGKWKINILVGYGFAVSERLVETIDVRPACGEK